MVKEEKKDNITMNIMGSNMMAREEQKLTWEEEMDMLTRFHRANVGFKCLTIDNEHEHDNDNFLKKEESWINQLDKPKANVSTTSTIQTIFLL